MERDLGIGPEPCSDESALSELSRNERKCDGNVDGNEEWRRVWNCAVKVDIRLVLIVSASRFIDRQIRI